MEVKWELHTNRRKKNWKNTVRSMHALRYFDTLTGEEKEELLGQIEMTDFSVVESCKHKEELAKKGNIEELDKFYELIG